MRLCSALCALLLCAALGSAQEISETRSPALNLQPSATPTGGSGLINLQTVPANPLGTLAISGHGFFVRHTVWDLGNENVATGMLSLTYSVTGNLEGYFSGSVFAGAHTISPNFTLTDAQKGFGSQEIGLKYRFPLKRTGVLQVGGTAGFILGTADTKVTGFNFANTRRHSDVKLRAIQSFRLQDRYGWPNVHVNEGYLTQYGALPDLFIFGLGADYLLNRRFQFMAEFVSMIEQRTPLYLNENYMALTPAVRYYHSSQLFFDAGVNLGLSEDRLTDNSWRRSDPWQVFLGLTFTPKISASDRDADGLPDWLDAELNLPPEYPKDSFGQLLDTDLDGVPDALDKEPTTMRGAVVDEHGVALDDDKDGVPVGLDRQTRTPADAWVDVYGIALDSDCDGVPDGIDEEPGSRPGTLVDSRGIAKDSDADGVPDGLDLEANSPAGITVDAWGRGMTAPAASTAGWINAEALARLDASLLKISDMHFALGSADIQPEDYSTLDIIGQTLAQFPQLVVLIEGHADSTGSLERNIELSYARARSVRDYLLEKFPALSRSNFTVTGLGEHDPLADDGTREGRILNRRVEIKILNREVLQEMITTWE